MTRATDAFVSLNLPGIARPSRLRLPYMAVRLLAAPVYPFVSPSVIARRLCYPACGWDEAVTRTHFRRCFGREINLTNPRTFSEKLGWLKLFHRKPIHETFADKVACYDFVRARGFGDALLERHGVWDRPEDVPLADLPETFVLKAAHGWHMNWFQRPGALLQVQKIRREMRRWVRTDHSLKDGEWQYRRLPRRILAEPLLQFPGGRTVDYKVFCFAGVPRLIRVIVGRGENGGTRGAHYDLNWRQLPFARSKRLTIDNMPRPAGLERMVEIAAALSVGEPFLRVDFYEVDGRIILGELTLYPNGGAFVIDPPEWDLRLGDWLDLPPAAV